MRPPPALVAFGLLVGLAPAARAQSTAPLTEAVPALRILQQRATPAARFARLDGPDGAPLWLMWDPAANASRYWIAGPAFATSTGFSARRGGVRTGTARLSLPDGREAQLTLALDSAAARVTYAWAGAGPIAVGAPMPPLTLRLLDGGTVATGALRGKVLVLNSWALFCAPCREEMPGLDSLATAYAGRDDVVFLAVAPDAPDALRPFLAAHPFRYTHALADDAATAVLVGEGGGYPRHVIVDAGGAVVYSSSGGSPTVHHRLRDALTPLLPPR